MSKAYEREVREAVVRLLEKKGYKVREVSEGRGVPRFSRIEIQKDGQRLICAVKLTTGGRISFTRQEDGTYAVLSASDRVIHAQPVLEDPSKVRVTMFDKATIVAAFEANYEALVEHEMTHLPSWLNPAPEAGWRQIGSGFMDQALWSEVVEVSPTASADSRMDGDIEHGLETTRDPDLESLLARLLTSGFDITIQIRPARVP